MTLSTSGIVAVVAITIACSALAGCGSDARWEEGVTYRYDRSGKCYRNDKLRCLSTIEEYKAACKATTGATEEAVHYLGNGKAQKVTAQWHSDAVLCGLEVDFASQHAAGSGVEGSQRQGFVRAFKAKSTSELLASEIEPPR